MTAAGPGESLAWLRRACVLATAVGAAWSALLSLTGGGLVVLGPVRLSSRNPMTPLAVAAAAAMLAFAIAPAGRRLAVVLADWDRLAARRMVRAGWTGAAAILGRAASRRPGSPSVAAVGAGLLAAGVVAIGIGHGTWAVGGSDVYGYASYARLWADGRLEPDRPLLDEFADPVLAAAIPPQALAPLGYVVRADRTLAPTYSPGLPIVMAAFARLGGPDAIFLVAPLLAGLAVWATYVLGRAIGGPPAGLAAAALLASSPAMLGPLTGGPMSDLPATAWWAACLALLSVPTRRAAAFAGAAASAAILTRPNLVPLAAVPMAWLAWQALASRTLDGPRSSRLRWRPVLFGTTVLPGCLAVAWLNTYWFGSPLASGYGPLSIYFSWDHLPVNLVRYPLWVVETQTPVVLVAFAAPWIIRRWGAWEAGPPGAATCYLAFVLAGFGCYAFYTPYEGWWWLRFVLPVFPALCALAAGALVAGAARVTPAGRRLLPVLVVAVALYGLAFARQQLVFDPAGEWKYPAVGAYIARHLPDRAVFLAMHHSGSVRYYTGRATVRYDLLPPSGLDAAIAALRARGYRPYILLDAMEEDAFRAHLAAGSRWGALDWAPLAVIEPDSVRIYDPAARE